jgi:hypothetical protein
LLADAKEEDLLTELDPERAHDLLNKINSSTLGRLLNRLAAKTTSSGELEPLLYEALEQRNRLSHSFYRRHNFRKNSDAGRTIMLNDLQLIQDSIMNAYKAIMLLSGIDLDSAVPTLAPTRAHLATQGC